MSILNFLKKATVEEIVAPVKKSGPANKQYSPNPALLAVRVFGNGAIYPSKAAVEKFDLEYKDSVVTVETLPLKDGETTAKTKNTYEFPNGTGNGFDLLDTRLWNQFKVEGDGAMLLIGVTPKSEPKIDMFGRVDYEKDGRPKVSVTEQGAVTFGKDVLVPAIEEVYGIKFGRPAVEASEGVEAKPAVEGVEFVDMVIFEELEGLNITEQFSKPIIFAPKRIVRGKDAGKPDYSRRENIKVYGFAPYQVLNPPKEESKPSQEDADNVFGGDAEEVDKLPIPNSDVKRGRPKKAELA